MARLKLQGMEYLGEIWLTHNMRELIVKNCYGLVKIFSSSIAMGSVMLEHLTIEDCEMMDAIFWKERGEDEAAATAVAKIQFPHLKYLRLHELPNLTHFCNSFEEVEFPKLEIANLYKLPKLDGLASKGLYFDKKDQALTIAPKAIADLQNLQELYVSYCGSVEVIFDLQQSNVNEGGNELAVLARLKYVSLSHLDNLRHVFTLSIAKVLVGLHILCVFECKNLEAIVAKEEEEEECIVGGGGGIILFPQLTVLCLGNLPKLLNMIPKPYTFNWPSLVKLSLGDCEKWIEILKDMLQATSNNMETQQVRELHNLTAYFPTSVLLQLQHLEGLGIRRCSSLQVVFDLQGLNVIRLAGAFQYLRSLTVSVCDSLRHVFTPSIAKLISRLQTLEISNCENLEALVAKEEEEEEEDIVEGGAGGGIFNLFPQLTRLSLKKLPKLLQITLRAYTFNWPSLKYLTLADCGKLTETLYNTIQAALVNMEILKVHKLDNITVFFPTSVLPQLQHLQMLEIQRCCSLEVVFNLQGFNDNNEGSYELIAPLLTQLWHINLHSLPKLRHVWKTGAHVIQGSFKNLSWLRVEHCDSLKYVFTPSVAKLLLVLKEMKIIECENLEAIVAEEEEEEECRLELGGGGGINPCSWLYYANEEQEQKFLFLQHLTLVFLEISFTTKAHSFCLSKLIEASLTSSATTPTKTLVTIVVPPITTPELQREFLYSAKTNLDLAKSSTDDYMQSQIENLDRKVSSDTNDANPDRLSS
ncbi:hypothetical protein LguiB_027014 [Lonicera macranthoides]